MVFLGTVSAKERRMQLRLQYIQKERKLLTDNKFVCIFSFFSFYAHLQYFTLHRRSSLCAHGAPCVALKRPFLLIVRKTIRSASYTQSRTAYIDRIARAHVLRTKKCIIYILYYYVNTICMCMRIGI